MCDEDSPGQRGSTGGPGTAPPARYLRCQAGTPLSVLQKFVSSKFQLPPDVQVQLISDRHVLPDDVTLMDLGYMGYLTRDTHMRLSFRLVQRRKRPAAQAEPNEMPLAKSARLEAPSPEAVGATSERLNTAPSEAVQVNPITSEAPASETSVMGATRLENPRTETTTRTAQAAMTLAVNTVATTSTHTSASVTKSSSPVLTVGSPPSPISKTSEPCMLLSPVPASKSPVLGTAAKSSSSPKPMGSPRVSATPPMVLISTEAMFDPDDEEPTSPQVVRDIIATLDAEESRSAEGTTAVASSISRSAAKAVDVLNESENVVCGNLGEDSSKQILSEARKKGAGQDRTRTIGGEVHVTNGRIHNGHLNAGKVMNECQLTSHSAEYKQPEVQNGGRKEIGEKFAHICMENNTSQPNSNDVSLGTNEKDEGVRPKVVNKASEVSIKSNGEVCHDQYKGTAKKECASDDANLGRSHPREDQTRAGASTGKVAEAAPIPISNKSMPAAAIVSTSTAERSVQSLSLLENMKLSKHAPHCAPSLNATDLPKASESAKVSPSAHPAKSSETIAKSESETTRHISKERTICSHSCKLNVPSPIVNTTASYKAALKTPKMQCTIRNITKPVNTRILKQSQRPVLAAEKPKSHPPHFQGVGFQQNTTQKQCPMHPTSPAKRANTQRDGAILTTPLDLSNSSKKTVAADSTSMLSSSPAQSPKPRSSKLKTGRSQNIHSIVDSLANREHISLTAIHNKASSQTYKLFNNSNSMEPLRKPSSPYASATDISRKAASQNGKATAGAARKPSHHSLPPVTIPSPMSPHRPLPMSLPMPEPASCYPPPSVPCSPPLHVDTTLASRLSYDMAMRSLLTFSPPWAMAQGGMVGPPHMFPMQSMFSPRSKGHDFHPVLESSLLRQQAEARIGTPSKKASPTAGTTAPQLRTPTALTSASIQHMEDLTKIVGKKIDKERHSVTVTPIPFKR